MTGLEPRMGASLSGGNVKCPSVPAICRAMLGLPIQNRKIELRAHRRHWHRIRLRLDVAARRRSPPRYSAMTTGHLSPTPTVDRPTPRASGAFLPFATFALAGERALAIPGALELVGLELYWGRAGPPGLVSTLRAVGPYLAAGTQGYSEVPLFFCYVAPCNIGRARDGELPTTSCALASIQFKRSRRSARC